MENFPYDPWQKCKTISGLAADLVISALQKEIRIATMIVKVIKYWIYRETT